jgi:ribosome-associated toxin RatA of RatAB toxin-antitoxin module
MKKAWSLGFLALALASMPSGAHADEDAEAQTLAKRKKALRYSVKTVAPANAIDTGGAAIYVNAPIAAVRKVVTDYRHYDEFIKPFEQSRLLSRKKGVSEVYFEVPIAHGAAKVWCVVNIAEPVKDGESEKIVATYNRGNVDDFRAVWRLRAVDATHTIVKLELLVDPKLPLPGSVVTPELQYAADKAVTGVRDRAENPKAVASAAPPPPGSSADKDAKAPSSVAKR